MTFSATSTSLYALHRLMAARAIAEPLGVIISELIVGIDKIL